MIHRCFILSIQYGANLLEHDRHFDNFSRSFGLMAYYANAAMEMRSSNITCWARAYICVRHNHTILYYRQTHLTISTDHLCAFRMPTFSYDTIESLLSETIHTYQLLSVWRKQAYHKRNIYWSVLSVVDIDYDFTFNRQSFLLMMDPKHIEYWIVFSIDLWC